MRTKQYNPPDSTLSQSSRQGRPIVSGNGELRGKVPASMQNWVGVGVGVGRWSDVFCQNQTLCHLQTARVSALAQLRAQRTEWRLTQHQLPRPVFQMKNVSPILGTALTLALLGSLGSLTPIAISPASTRSGDWGPPGWALPAQAVPFPLGQEAQRGLGAHGGWQVIPLRGKGPPA